MISILADIIGIISGIIAIFSYMQNQKNKKIDQSQVNIIYNMRSSTYVSTFSDTPFFDGETTLFLWGIFFLSGIYIYEHYRYWIMVAASIFILILTSFIYFYFKSRFCVRPLPRSTLRIYLLTVFFTSATIISTAFIVNPVLGYSDIFHASQILSVIMSTLVMSILVWRMVSFSRGKAVNLHHLSFAAAAAFVCFLLASGLLEKISELLRVDF